MDQKQVLMIAYFFPPLGGSGSLRPLKLAKYMPENGWKPVVLTVANPDWYYATDKELLDELPPEAAVWRSRMIRSAWFYRILNPMRNPRLDQWIQRFIVHPDNQVGWIPFAFAAGLRLVRKFPIQAIYSTSAPLSSHLIASLIKKKTGLPWIADFRDEWFENPDLSLPTAWHRKMHFYLEKSIVEHADHVIGAALGFCALLGKHQTAPDKFSELTMGFDPEDFHSKVETKISWEDKEKFTIAFSGLFYGSFRPIRFLSALTSLIDENKISSKKIRVVFVGANSSNDTRFRDAHRICFFTGFVSHRQSIQIINSVDALLLLLSKERGSKVIPSKTFEYMASGKPILALVPPDGAAASIIRKTRSGRVVDFDDFVGIKSAVLKLYNDWETQRMDLVPDTCKIEKFNQKQLSLKFSEILRRITG
jgi:glycosyltransferase involved in cell wall biosynthesis